MSNVSPEEVFRLVAEAFHIPPHWLCARRRAPEFRLVPPAARDVAVYLMRRHTRITLAQAGHLMGCLHSGATTQAREYVLAAEFWLKQCPELEQIVDRVEDAIEALHEARLDGAAPSARITKPEAVHA